MLHPLCFRRAFRRALTLCPLLLSVGAAACAPAEPADSAQSTESAYTSIAEGSPEAKGVLRVANEATAMELLTSVGLSAQVVDNIVANRLGDDGASGTSDDVTYTSLAQLDAVPYVTSTTLDSILAYAMSHGLVLRTSTAGGAPGTWTVVPKRTSWTPGTRWTRSAEWVDGTGVLLVGPDANRYEPTTDLVFPTPLPASWKGSLYEPVMGHGPTTSLALSYSYSTSSSPWGGSVSAALYDHATRTWSESTTTGLELDRQAAVVWAGDRFIVVIADPYGNTNIRVQSWIPGQSAWSPVTTYRGVGVERFNGAFWTGHDLLVWGTGVPLHFDPAAPAAAAWHAGPVPTRTFKPYGYGAVWAGNRLVSIMDRAAYDPQTETWSSISGIGAPPDCARSVVALVGTKIVVWGGQGPNVPYSSGFGTGYREVICSAEGAVYDLLANTWAPIAPAPGGRRTESVFASSGNLLWIGGGRGGTSTIGNTMLSEVTTPDLVYVP